MAKTRFTIESRDAQQISKTLTGKVNVYRKGLKLEMWRALTLLEAAIIIEIQRNFKRRTGALMNSIGNSKEVIENGLQIIGQIGPVGVVYARIHELGGKTRPHIIRPRYKQALRWVGSQGSYMTLNAKHLRTNKLMVFAKEVHHPGSNIPARPYLAPAFLKTKDKILARFGLYLTANFKFAER